MKIYRNISESELKKLVFRPRYDADNIKSKIKEIFENIKDNGDQALYDYTLKFDNVKIDSLEVLESTLKEAYYNLDEQIKAAILIAKENIEKFHTAQLSKEIEVETTKGVTCYQKSIPINKIGIYIPGGTAPLFSTILMLAIPAKIAGVKEIIMFSPPASYGEINPITLAVAYMCGVNKVYQVGGAQAIAAMALGTSSIQKVDKIFGPGNQYVTAAKEEAMNYNIAIDLPAGPSELIVFSDESCIPAFVASDLLSQAEHGIDSQVIAVVNNNETADNILAECNKQLLNLPRKEIAEKALENSFILIEPNIDKSFKFINEYAPEHLIIASEKFEEYTSFINNAGSVFLGNYSPESAGDYASGTNHTLPTYGWAKSYSGVNIDSFMRKVTFQKLTKEGIKNIGNTIITMAEAESLIGHANAVRIRLDNINTEE